MPSTRLDSFSVPMPKLLRAISSISSHSSSSDGSSLPQTPLATPPGSVNNLILNVNNLVVPRNTLEVEEEGYFPADAFINTTSEKELAFIKRTGSFGNDIIRDIATGEEGEHNDNDSILSAISHECDEEFRSCSCDSETCDADQHYRTYSETSEVYKEDFVSSADEEDGPNGDNPPPRMAIDIERLRAIFQGHMNFGIAGSSQVDHPIFKPFSKKLVFDDEDCEIVGAIEEYLPKLPFEIAVQGGRPFRVKPGYHAIGLPSDFVPEHLETYDLNAMIGAITAYRVAF